MFSKKIVVLALLSVAAALPSFAIAAPASAPTSECVLSGHRVTGVQPLRVATRYGRGVSERLLGATVFIQAEPGLTAEWLQLTIQRHMTQMGAAGMANCVLDAKDVRVNVASAGAGFAVQITGKDSAQAKEILRRAQLLAS